MSLKGSMAMGQVHEVDNNPHLLGSYELSLNPGVWNPEPVIPVSFFSFFLFHFLSFNILPHWIWGSWLDWDLVWMKAFLRFREMVIFTSCANTRCSLLLNQSYITNYVSLRTTLYMLPWTLPLHYSLSVKAYWEGPQNDGWKLCKIQSWR